MSAFVLDASVALAWGFEDERTPFVTSVQHALRAGSTALVPHIWPAEVANGVRTAQRRGRLSLAESDAFVVLLLSLPVRVASSSPTHTFQRLLPFALAQGLTVYDAAYLDLALNEGLPLVTLDQQLRVAAQRVGVALPDAS